MAGGDQLFARFGRTCSAGETLFREDEPGDTMYVIQTGRVRITKEVNGEIKSLAVLGAGEFFGEMAILNNKPRNATAEVIEDARMLVIDAKTFGQMIASNTEIAIRLIKKLARRLDAADALIEILMHRDPKARVILGLSREVEMGSVEQEDGSVLVPIQPETLAEQVGLTLEETSEVLGRLGRLRIVDVTPDGFVINDVRRLSEFLDFLEMREKYGDS